MSRVGLVPVDSSWDGDVHHLETRFCGYLNPTAGIGRVMNVCYSGSFNVCSGTLNWNVGFV